MSKKLFSNSYLTIILLAFVFGIFFVSCNEFEGDQQTPSFIYIKGFNMVENPAIPQSSTEGFQTSAITDAWVYVDNIYIGTYSLPCKVPILKKGNHKIEIKPGIKLNGISLTRSDYPFYTSYTNTHNLKELETDTIETMDITYRDDWSVFAISELFENSFLSFKTEGLLQDTNKLIILNDPTIVKKDGHLGGTYCGAMYLGANETTYRVISDSINCNNKSTVVMEIDYWCNIPFGIGMTGKTSSAAQAQYLNVMTLNPNDGKGWQKVYIVLGKVWSQLSYPEYFRVFLTPLKKDGVQDGWIYVDNIKIIHYPNN
ncbi:MAG: hypothetical protein PHV65_05170 [Bacteroidales bacterium]|nr:hypothetical protein [Bacteroidales bacterium]